MHLTRLIAPAAASAALIAAPAALASGVSPARGATRHALVRAFVAQDGTSAGISGAFVSGSMGVVCQRTPDAGLVRFVFRHSGRSWRYVLSARNARTGSAVDQRLERACG